MQIFLSYPSVRRDVAERLKMALEAEGHGVFFDRDDLASGEPFHRAIRDAVAGADLCIFLITPESVAAGSYTLAELGFVQQRWPRPAGRLLPVMVAPTPRALIPAYLLAVTLLEPRGELVAETVARVAGMGGMSGHRARIMLAAAIGVVIVAVLGLFAWRGAESQRAEAARSAAAERASADAQRALALCQGGAHAEGFDALARLAAAAASPPAVRTAHEDCAMSWLRVGRVTVGHSTFEQLVAPLKPLLAQALVAGAGGARAGDLHAHLGWADALVRLDGRTVSVDPEASFRRALQADPANVYGHAMWASWMLRRGSARTAEALQHFEAALASGRDTGFVRSLQLGMMVTSDELAAEAHRVLNRMRANGERLEAAQRPRIWSYLYARAYRDSEAKRLTEAVPAAEALATFRWLFRREDLDASQHTLWRLVDGLLLTRAGRAGEARPDLEALRRELRASRASGPIVDSVDALLAGR